MKQLLYTTFWALILGIAIPATILVMGIIVFCIGLLLCLTIIGILLGLVAFGIGGALMVFAVTCFWPLFIAGFIGGIAISFMPLTSLQKYTVSS